MTDECKKLSVIVPVFNSRQSLEQLSTDIWRHCVPVFSENIEVIFVDDGSIDGSWEEICRITKNTKNTAGLRLEKNFSQHNALLAGILYSTGEWILTIDDDLQHPLENLSAMKELTTHGFDLVYGANMTQPVHGLSRLLATMTIKYIFKFFLRIPNATDISAFRLISGRLRNYARSAQGPTISIDALLSAAGFHSTSYLVSFKKRQYGQSNYSTTKLITHSLKTVLSFSVVPLQIAALLGVIIIIFSVLLLLYVVTRALIEPSVPGFPFLASIVAFFSGVQLILLGIQGLYLGEIHARSMGHPPFIIANTIRHD